MRILSLMLLMLTTMVSYGQKSKYYGWWEHKGALFGQDSLTHNAIKELGVRFNLTEDKLAPLSESEIQFYEDSFKLNYGISVSTGDGDSREFKWFTVLSGVWKIDNNAAYKKDGRYATIRENNFTTADEHWKDSIVNKPRHFTLPASELILLKFNSGAKAYGLFTTTTEYPNIWFYLDYGFGNIYTKYY